MAHSATTSLMSDPQTSQTSDEYANSLYQEAILLNKYSTTNPRDQIIAIFENAKPKLQSCSPASVRKIAAFLVYLTSQKYVDNKTSQNLDAQLKAMQWNLTLDKDNLDIEASIGNQLFNKYEHGWGSLDDTIEAFERLANKVDRVINDYLEDVNEKSNAVEGHSTVPISSSESQERSSVGEIARPKFGNSVFMARLSYVFMLDDKYNKADRYSAKALDDLIRGSEAAVRFYETAEQDDIGEQAENDKRLACAATLLNRALMARLFRSSSQESSLSFEQTSSNLRISKHSLMLESPALIMANRLGNMSIEPPNPGVIYEKTPLISGTKQIRLLDLHPGGPEEDLLCTLRIVDLYSQPKYEALSYVWGDPNMLAPMTVNDTTVNITKNLNTALRRLRLPSAVRCLWVDALCINQKDVAEKQQQIGLMRDIYASATGVTMWLGDPWPTKKDPVVQCTHEFFTEISNALTTDALFSLLPYLEPVSSDTVEGKAMRQTETQAAGFRKTLERLPSVLLPIRRYESYADEIPITFAGYANPMLAFYDAIEKMNTRERFKDLCSFNRWARSSKGPQLKEFDWENDRSIAKILKSPFDAHQWPVVGALCILQALSSDVHLHDLPFFEKNEDTISHVGQAWAKSASKLCELLNNPYWGRAWILQEIVLGRSPIIYFGAHKIPFFTLAIAQQNFRKHSHDCCRTIINNSSLDSSVNERSWWYKIDTSFTSIRSMVQFWGRAVKQRHDEPGFIPKFGFPELVLLNTGKRKASDPRDLVYAMLGLVDDDDERTKMEADYRLTTAQVFACATAQIHQRKNDLYLLCWPVFRAENPFGLPSWSPDWTHDVEKHGHKSAMSPTDGYNACLDKKWNGELLDDLCLSVQSYSVDMIDRISERFHVCVSSGIDVLQKQLLMWHKLAFPDSTENHTHSGKRKSRHPWLVRKKPMQEPDDLETRRKREFLHTIIGKSIIQEAVADMSNLFENNRHVKDDDISLMEEWWDWLTAKPPGPSEDEHNQNEYSNWMEGGQKYFLIHKKCVDNTFHKRFFVTKHGQFGLGLCSYTSWGLVAWPTAFQGDEIHILEGCNMPVLLRPLAGLRGKGGGKAILKPRNPNPGADSPQSDNNLKANSFVYSAPLDKCGHSKEQVFQFSGLCYVQGLMDGAVLQDGNVTPSMIYLR